MATTMSRITMMNTMTRTEKIKLNLKIEHVNKLCAICEGLDFDVNVICGRVCVDGRSVMGVSQMCGRVVLLVPVTDDEYEIETLYRQVAPLGAYKTEDF